MTGRTVSVRIDEEVVDYRPQYDQKGIDVMKTTEPDSLHHPGMSISKRNSHIDNVLSHLYDMQMLQLRMSEVKEE
ncbi:hypothetical protein HAX54_047183 [Datura stramonium]|uniref:Uncharacterized protein n=1 Tax=Datura stramonium TaxID=4076 RepID=A0ABS8WHY4_DATST|nr:hypothetical protein [Datura stramonium]